MTYNLADSGCHPVRLSELVSDPAAVEKLLAVDLHYPPVHIIAPQMLQCNPAQKDENSGTCCLHTTCPEVVACKKVLCLASCTAATAGTQGRHRLVQHHVFWKGPMEKFGGWALAGGGD